MESYRQIILEHLKKQAPVANVFEAVGVGLKKYSEDQERDENGRWTGGGATDGKEKDSGGAKANPFSEVPAAPGTTPIKEGDVRLYHQTNYQNVDEIAKEGITFEHAKGYEGPKAIYADEKGFYGKPTDMPTVEFAVSKDRAADKPFVHGDVTPKDIIAIHLPWQETVRYLTENNQIKDVVAGKFDFITKDRSEKDWRAVQYIKENNGGTPEKGWKEYRDFPARTD